ncbi:hypothetical protein GOPIP_005_00010 [Gordonia polyisoprenivorans NBRC 16320 = JCM 10675]|uniref:Uncharacterized protein n=1 Tax=Gordonia polyisoprenivorans TaxID=84595 RepID=A0A846WQ22_9ACTN|nr:hypothetical protein [Gordonia polyisoprenivorans]NKY03086.1 hypothetical protein [Gordonia polyisoprenivorans]GAB21189.1 hypothetical protein GOPIP_005_00010 [Gordonia polyisoprenivorans NBRC 16320 = JCM 10675]
MSLGREHLLAYAMAARTMSAALRQARERNGRAAWSPTNEAARIQLAADAAAIDRLTPAKAAEWNQRVADGDLYLHADRDTGLVRTGAPLSDGTHVVQATLDERTVAVVAGSTDTARHLHDWLAENPHHGSLTDLAAAARDIADDRERQLTTEQADSDRTTRSTTSTAAETTAGLDNERADTPATPLRDLLDGRVPARIFDDKRRGTAEKQFADLVDEDQARREAAAEWLATATDSPTDRARASRLLGEIDTDFDTAIAQKYPGILAVTPSVPDVDEQWLDHTHRADTETELAHEHTDTADRVDDADLAVVHGPFTTTDDMADAIDTHRDQTVADELGEAADHHHTASDQRDLAANAESDRSRDAARDDRALETAASAPLTAASGAGAIPGRGRGTAPSRERPHVQTPTRTQTRGRSR